MFEDAEEEEDPCARFDRMQTERTHERAGQVRGDGAEEIEEEEERMTETDEDLEDPQWKIAVDERGLPLGEVEDDSAAKTDLSGFMQGALDKSAGTSLGGRGWKHVRRRCRGCSVAADADEDPRMSGRDDKTSLASLLRQLQVSASGGPKACGKPQASHVSDSKVVLTWRPPDNAIGKDLFAYEIQQSSSPRPPPWTPKEDSWEPIANQVTVLGHELGSLHTCSWVVEALTGELFYCFRVRVANCDQYSGWSAHSNPFGVGLRNYSPCGIGVGGDTWTKEEMALFRSLDSPGKVQDFLDTMPMNQEVDKDVSLSALECVRQNHAHCLEGALLGAYILSLHGHRAQLMDLRANADDDDHVVTPFQVNGLWGCLSVSNHSSLRFRNPAYRSLRELVVSYFDDYMNGKGHRTLRAYSLPIDLEKEYGKKWWAERGDDGSRAVAAELDRLKHFRLFPDGRSKQGMRGGDEFMLCTTVAQREWHYPPNADEAAQERNQNR